MGVIIMNKQEGCIFCRKNFPYDYQLVSKAPNFWLFVLNINPQTDLHSLIVLNAEKAGHISDLTDENLPPKALEELGILLNRACKSIKAADREVAKVLVTSLNMGGKSEHLHFHLIPKRNNEKVRTVADPEKDGGGMFFMARKEIVVDTYKDFLNSTTGGEGEELICKIREATKSQVIRNAEALRKTFDW
jgi:diadenosine tetraphosphate (Ap4A) HIT family hydrolase